ncbi:hypothetical protein [Streptomyces sp. NPDC052042]|uniref:hypothetical protein n=1 Tax=Streptomyces sp. NPDC052042 TaxID=3365683 RepID=UPI0037D504B9
MATIRARHARTIRIGIQARRLPYVTRRVPEGGWFTSLAVAQMWDDTLRFENLTGRRKRLARRAFDRTRPWASEKIQHEDGRIERIPGGPDGAVVEMQPVYTHP